VALKASEAITTGNKITIAKESLAL
jgi:hypothetical protein